ncbi:hypothetical protein SAMN02746066_00243 [Anaerosporobacter mobilis DSM 15930]|uniref:Uncharacterized protein n=1 Tax=Anaerosporobacter mobilis DSM 15930 TaxID=1120996 RepID=A0A1M7EWL5_9FIRM|nr:DUF6115 domain-containing protein [Anaerosporobacter mobilis]SHL96100.1 hypothetical protein SAMN02746066_00243 [Anaerosporobacter mobilis DSM 15930]
MTVFEVCMLILGLVLIGVSFFFTEKVTSKGKKEEVTNSIIGLDEEHLLVIQNTLEENLEKISEATIVKTENDLNKVTNEKIMAISEYSEQILEKIEQNHMEVVFLYNMLNEKENAMKENYCKKENKTKDSESKSNDLENQTDTNNSTVIDSKVTEPEREIQGINDEEAAMLVNNTNYSYNEQEFTDEDKQNNNQEIMKLYTQGKSITEIAKTLDLGKGEVSFVLNLYKQN